MRSGLERMMNLAILVFFLAGCVLLLVAIDKATLRIRLATSRDELLSSRIPLVETQDGAIVGAPDLFWGRIEAAPAINLSGNCGVDGETCFSLAQDLRPLMQPCAGKVHEIDPVCGPFWYEPRIPLHEALAQVPRIAQARGFSERELAVLVAQQSKGRLLGILEQLESNTSDLNQALEQANLIRATIGLENNIVPRD